jgi:enamine deaminase RidA (YjgF/YER057c/UK114 family)
MKQRILLIFVCLKLKANFTLQIILSFMSQIEKRLSSLNLELKSPKLPVGNYLGSKRVGELLFASGRVSDLIGEVGTDVTEQAARKAARDTVLLILAIVKEDIGDLDQLKGVVKMQGFVRCTNSSIYIPHVLDGASDLLIELFEEDGRHSRTATGVSQLPFGASVQIDIIFLV